MTSRQVTSGLMFMQDRLPVFGETDFLEDAEDSIPELEKLPLFDDAAADHYFRQQCFETQERSNATLAGRVTPFQSDSSFPFQTAEIQPSGLASASTGSSPEDQNESANGRKRRRGRPCLKKNCYS